MHIWEHKLFFWLSRWQNIKASYKKKKKLRYSIVSLDVIIHVDIIALKSNDDERWACSLHISLFHKVSAVGMSVHEVFVSSCG